MMAARERNCRRNAGEERSGRCWNECRTRRRTALALRASGTVMAQDVEAAIEAALGPIRGRDRPRHRHRSGFRRLFRRAGARADERLAGPQVAGQARGRHRRRTDGRSQAQRLRRLAGSRSAVRRGRREGRAGLGRGGAARRVGRRLSTYLRPRPPGRSFASDQSIRVASLSLSMPVGCSCAPNANVTDSIVPVNGNRPFLA